MQNVQCPVIPLGEMVILQVLEQLEEPVGEVKSEGGIILGKTKTQEEIQDKCIPKTAIIASIGPEVPQHINLEVGDKIVYPTNKTDRVKLEDKEDKRIYLYTHYKNIAAKYIQG